jgi:cytochrome o ubiquinol oxidase subunit 2
MTSSRVMNALNIPAMAGQVYAMPGMKKQKGLHGVINQPGDYKGYSSRFSQHRLLQHALPSSGIKLG